MIDFSQFITTFTTYDKLAHFLIWAGLFRFLVDWLEPKFTRLAVACTAIVLGMLYEFFQLANGQWFDGYDMTANVLGVLAAWLWVWYWKRKP